MRLATAEVKLKYEEKTSEKAHNSYSEVTIPSPFRLPLRCVDGFRSLQHDFVPAENFVLDFLNLYMDNLSVGNVGFLPCCGRNLLARCCPASFFRSRWNHFGRIPISVPETDKK